MSMNCSPPRAMETKKAAILPAVKARIRNRLSWNKGSATLDSMTTNAANSSGAADQPGENQRTHPTRGVPTVGLDAEGDADQDGTEPDGEGDVAPPVDAAALSNARLAKFAIGPKGPEDADGYVDPEHCPPVDSGEQTSRHQADEHPGQPGNLVDAEGKTPLVRRGMHQSGSQPSWPGAWTLRAPGGSASRSATVLRGRR